MQALNRGMHIKHVTTIKHAQKNRRNKYLIRSNKIKAGLLK